MLLLIVQSPAHEQQKLKLPSSSNLKTQLLKVARRLSAARMSDMAGVALSATEQGDRRASWSVALPLAQAGEAL